MYPFPLPDGASDPIDVGEGTTIVGFAQRIDVLVAEFVKGLEAAGWTCEVTGGLHTGNNFFVAATKGGEQWSFSGMGVDDSCQLSISRQQE